MTSVPATSAAPATHPAASATPAWVRWSELPEATLESLRSRVKVLPRPPQAIHELLSESFIDRASSTELGKLVMSEPVAAARVLASVNSPMYRLAHPVTSIGQAVTFLGINQVRSICIQVMLINSFVTREPLQRQTLDMAWHANASACLVLPRLAPLFHVRDVSALTSRVILAGVGQLAAATLLPTATLPAWMAASRIARHHLEQEALGVNAAELTHLVLSAWGIPAELADEVQQIERLVTALPDRPEPSHIGAATGYLALWMGEQLAHPAGGADAPDWNPLATMAPELQTWAQLLSQLGVPWDAQRLGKEDFQKVFSAARESRTRT